MAQPVPIVLVPGLTCSARLFTPQLPVLWPIGPVTIADHRRDDSMEAIAKRILADAPPSFAARYVGARRHAGAGDDTQDADRNGEGRPLRGNFRPRYAALHSRRSAGRRAAEGDRAPDGARNRSGSVRPPDDGNHDTAGFASAIGVHQVPDVDAG